MLKNFENWLLQNNYKPTTAADYMGRIKRLCRNEQFTLAHLVENIASNPRWFGRSKFSAILRQ